MKHFGGRLEILWRKLVFFFGDLRRLRVFPWLTWDVHQHMVGFDEMLDALPLIRPGDIGLHTDRGYFSNLVIPGFFKHAWIFTDFSPHLQIVEAVSEGVLHRNALVPMRSDYVIILRPKPVSPDEIRGAVKKARQIVGAKYDVHFKFDIEEELRYYQGRYPEEAADDLRTGQAWLQEFDHGFSCTEVVSYAWWHKREALRIQRVRRGLQEIILADGFLNPNWEIVWKSASVTPKAARSYGLAKDEFRFLFGG
jgi:hypothetical protein